MPSGGQESFRPTRQRQRRCVSAVSASLREHAGHRQIDSYHSVPHSTKHPRSTPASHHPVYGVESSICVQEILLGIHSNQENATRAPEYNDRSRSTSRPINYTPSFVHSINASPVNIDPRRHPDTMRHPGWATFWSVDGLETVSIGQLRGVPSGNGTRLVSGTNAPMHTSEFLDEPRDDDTILAHERRIALALEIDQAARMLASASTRNDEQKRVRGVDWQEGTWKRHGSVKGTPTLMALSYLTNRQQLPFTKISASPKPRRIYQQ